MTLADTLGLAGAIGLAALLDVAVRPAAKRKFSAWLGGLASRSQAVGYGGSAFLDRLFGPTILSKRAIPRYVLFSLASISASYLFAVLTSPPDVMQGIWISTGSISFLDWAILITCFGFAVLGDIISYSQTRLFVRAIDRARNGIISIGLVAADIIISLSIFFFMFSFARLVCVLAVLSVQPTQILTHTDHWAPDLMKDALLLMEVDTARSDQPATRLAIAIANADTPGQERRAALTTRELVSQQFGSPRTFDQVTFDADFGCPTGDNHTLDAARASSNTEELFRQMVAEQAAYRTIRANVTEISDAMHLAAFVRPEPGAECGVKVLTVTGSIESASLIALAGPVNSWWAAFERTLFDAYQVVGFKLSPYVGFDPYLSAPDYAASLTQQVQISFLGAFPVDVDRARLVTFFDDPVRRPQGQINVPFTPMVASALTASFFLTVYMLAVSLASARSVSIGVIKRILPAFQTEQAVFTILTLAVIGILIFATGTLWVMSALWRFALA